MVNKTMSDGESYDCNGNHPASPPLSIDDCPISVPAAGNRNGTSLNNAGENGNYWSSTPNESNSNNAYNLNFNSGDHNTNWNNRNNGFSVRGVSEFADNGQPRESSRHFSLSKEQLLKDLYRAYKDARKHKRGRSYQLRFEYHLEDNLVALRNELFERRYHPSASDCFIIHDPKMREVFAAKFRDRIVHHLFYNYTHRLFERTFIHDSYSCIEKRGTHFGIERLKHHVRSVSGNFKQPCYVLKVDIRGYFMSIDRNRLRDICIDTIDRHYKRKACPQHEGIPEIDFVKYLLEQVLCFNPIEDCRRIGEVREWEGLPPEKSLFHSDAGCGLPIGNLSSQLFSNVYMNKFDQFAKRELKCRHYGRYVDDAYIVASDRKELKRLIPRIESFLECELGLKVNQAKTRIFNVYHGVEFLGAFIKPHRTYISTASLKRIVRKVNLLKYCHDARQLQSSVNSFLGVLSHYDSYCLRKVLFTYRSGLNKRGVFSNNILKFRPHGR